MDIKDLKRLSKFLDYVLGRHPYEFGLVPDSNGFVKLKDLLKAINEENGWRHLRKSHLNELSISHVNSPIEITETLIRTTHRDQLPKPLISAVYPKLLYTCVRTRAYPVILEKGIFPRGYCRVVLAADSQMALRIGKRIDPSPILLTVNVGQVQQAGIEILSFGQMLFLAPQIPIGCFTGPPIPKEKIVKKEKKQPLDSPDSTSPSTPGSYYLDLNRGNKTSIAKNKGKGKKEKGWKEERRREKRRRDSEWP